MNGPIAQLVALTCHGNAFLRHGSRSPFFPDNSTCKFCDRVTFVERRRRWFGNARVHPVAGSPDEWFAYLARTGARGLWLSHRAGADLRISDRMSAGFIGGGAAWTISCRYDEATQYWEAKWEVWNRNAPAQRIWRVRYDLAGTRRGPSSIDADVAAARVRLSRALTRICAFASAHDCAPFTDCFRRALESLDTPFPMYGYHTDHCPEGSIEPSIRALLDAAQSAWVFGGMGSWNDLGFDGDAAGEYDAVSTELYSAILDAICAAANSTDSAAPSD
jgi:hypothetical protein